MKIAVLGDIHGNIEALKAAYDAASSRHVDRIYHLGDLGGYAPFVNEVVDFLGEHGIDGVQGNYDEAVANDREHCGCRAEEPLQEEMAHLSFAWTKQHVSQRSREYMGGLPQSLELTAQGKTIMFFHATPHKNNLYWNADRPEKFFLEMAGKADADILVYGHTHWPYTKQIGNRLFINAGSVGKPKDGDPRACVAVVDLAPQAVLTEFVRVAYDVEKVASAIIENGLPPYFADRLRSGA